MIRNFKLSIGISCLALLNGAYAGDMGKIAPAVFNAHNSAPFISAEGFPVWINFGGIRTTNNSTTHSADTGNYLAGGGRGAAGFSYTYTDKIDFTAEAGWNYFGRTSGSVSGTAYGATLTGTDLLLGATYRKNNYGVYIKGGTLFQRSSVHINVPSTYYLTSGTTEYFAAVAGRFVVTDVLPEVKVGLTYDINPQWGASVAYMHAFGDTPKITTALNSTATTANSYVGVDLRGPTLNSVLFGMTYHFV